MGLQFEISSFIGVTIFLFRDNETEDNLYLSLSLRYDNFKLTIFIPSMLLFMFTKCKNKVANG